MQGVTTLFKECAVGIGGRNGDGFGIGSKCCVKGTTAAQVFGLRGMIGLVVGKRVGKGCKRGKGCGRITRFSHCHSMVQADDRGRLEIKKPGVKRSDLWPIGATWWCMQHRVAAFS